MTNAKDCPDCGGEETVVNTVRRTDSFRCINCQATWTHGEWQTA